MNSFIELTSHVAPLDLSSIILGILIMVGLFDIANAIRSSK